MRSIYRYIINPEFAYTEVMLTEGSEVFAAGWWKNNVCIWAFHEPDKASVNRRFVVYGTGTTFPNHSEQALKFIGQALMTEDGLVFHVFEVVG